MVDTPASQVPAQPPSQSDTAAHEQTSGQFILPAGIVSKVDTGRLLRELEALDDHMHQAALKKDTSTAALPSASQLLTDLIAVNHLNVASLADRKRVVDFVSIVHNSAPVLHMSFSAEPSQQFITKLVAWLRKEIHPVALVQVGLQPNIGAGCIVRTTNKYFDFSLRQRFKQKREQLLGFFVKANTIAQPAVTAPVQGESQQ